MKLLTFIPENWIYGNNYKGGETISCFSICSELLNQSNSIDCLSESMSTNYSKLFNRFDLSRINFINQNDIKNDYDFYISFSGIEDNKYLEIDKVNYCKSIKNNIVKTGWGSCDYIKSENSRLIHYIMIAENYQKINLDSFCGSHSTVFTSMPFETYNPTFDRIIIGSQYIFSDSDIMNENWIYTFNYFSKNYHNIIFDLVWDEVERPYSPHQFVESYKLKNVRLIIRKNYNTFMSYLSNSIGYIHPFGRDTVSAILRESVYMKVPTLFTNNSHYSIKSNFPTMKEDGGYLQAIDAIDAMINYSKSNFESHSNHSFKKMQEKIQEECKMKYNCSDKKIQLTMKKIEKKLK